MFVLCIAYMWVSLCCSSDLSWYVKIVTPTALVHLDKYLPVSGAIAFWISKNSTKYHLCRHTPLLFADTPLQASVVA